MADGAELGQVDVPGAGEFAIGGDGRVVQAIGFYESITPGDETFHSEGGSDFVVGPFVAPGADR